MKFLIDADSPLSLVQIFRKHGHSAAHVREVLGHVTDDEIFVYAKKNRYVIVTRDLGFAEMFLERKGQGLLLIRLPYYFTADKIAKALDDFLKGTDCTLLGNSITVLELGRYRIKKL